MQNLAFGYWMTGIQIIIEMMTIMKFPPPILSLRGAGDKALQMIEINRFNKFVNGLLRRQLLAMTVVMSLFCPDETDDMEVVPTIWKSETSTKHTGNRRLPLHIQKNPCKSVKSVPSVCNKKHQNPHL